MEDGRQSELEERLLRLDQRLSDIKIE
jgi:hypothetical protein